MLFGFFNAANVVLILPDRLKSSKPDAFSDTAVMETEQRHVGAVRPHGCTPARTRAHLQSEAAGCRETDPSRRRR